MYSSSRTVFYLFNLALQLLTLPGRTATVLRSVPHRAPQTIPYILDGGTLKFQKSENVQEDIPSLNVFQPTGLQDTDGPTDRTGLRPRPRRAAQRGCQLGTCQLHNLANTLYRIGQTSGKDESKKANDPQGYGR